VPTSQKPKPKGKKHTLTSKRGTRSLKRLSTADVVGSKAIIDVYEQRRSSIESTDRLDIDSGLWGRARTQWMLGDWDSLASLELSHLEQAPHRAELAALSACAQLQKGDKQSARQSLAAASRWHCAPAFIVRALVAGIEASMARHHEICGRDDKSLQLLASSAGALGGDGRLSATARKALSNRQPPPQSVASAPSPKILPSPDTDSESFAMTLEEAVAVVKKEEQAWPKQSITSYAQNFEDVTLWRALGHITNGFYIDIGANDPEKDSINKSFHDHGWRGLHIDAACDWASRLLAQRAPETVIHAVVGAEHGVKDFYHIPDTGISTANLTVAAMLREKGHENIHRKVLSLTLDDLLSYASNIGAKDVHWMNIDVEGSEGDIIRSWRNDTLPRPWIILVESVVPTSQVMTFQTWEEALLRKEYIFAYSDRLTRFYVAKEHAHLAHQLSHPPSVFDNFDVSEHSSQHKRWKTTARSNHP
jgi:FkbM family methyltransferase